MGMAIVVVMLLLSPFLPLRGQEGGPGTMLGLPALFTVEATHVTAPTLGVTGAEIREAHGYLRMPIGDRTTLVGTLLFALAALAIVRYGVGQLRKVLVALREERPFDPANAVRIRRIAYVVIGGELLRAGFTFAGNFYVAQHFVADGLRFDVTLGVSVPTLVAGLIIFVLAEVFREGTRLEEEQSLTV
jgi:hypothetical protein